MDATEVERSLATYYDAEAADRADRDLDPERIEARAAVLATLPAGHRLLEVGVGPGRDAAAFVDAGLEVTGIDLSFEHARLAAGVGARTIGASVRDPPFADAAFDVVGPMSTQMHVPSSAIVGALAEVRRVLAPGGRLVAGVWGGSDVEDHLDNGRFGPPRLFSRRSDETWRSMLAAGVGDVEEFRTWARGFDPFWYQFAVVRSGG